MVDARLAELRHLLPLGQDPCLLLVLQAKEAGKSLEANLKREGNPFQEILPGYLKVVETTSNEDALKALKALSFPSLCIILTQGGNQTLNFLKAELSQRGFTDIRGYRLAPSIKEVRWIIPAESRRAAAASLALYQPSLVKARLKKIVARVLSRIGLVGFWAPDLAIVAGKNDFNPPSPKSLDGFFEELLGCPVELALFTGTPGYYRKPTMQVMDQKGQVLAFAKLAVNEQTEAMLANEYFMLKRLHELTPRHFSVPRVLHYGEVAGNGMLVLYLTS